jgi:DNA polymerase-3 subunit gamma/tau
LENDYLVFTRKWRPQLFSEIIGQEQITEPLQRAIELKRIMHAYLFSGPRGVGKTTTARVFAKALNCVNGPTTTPCNVCPSCVGITDGSDMDVIEIDGASNNGVEQVRELRERIGLSTTRSKYKIYIIDEVHMLSDAAFNALLKTLEEPPKHVIFIFATTDPQDIPQTILSRCQHFRFKRMSIDNIVKNLMKIAEHEKIKCDPKAFYTIARGADGALRDAQRILDQFVTYARGQELTDSLASEMLGEIDSDLLNNILLAVVKKDLKAALSVTQAVIEKGFDLKDFLGALIESFRNMLVIKTVKQREMIETTDEQFEFLGSLGATVGKETILFYLQKALEIETRVSKSSMPAIVLEAFAAELIISSPGAAAEVPTSLEAQKPRPPEKKETLAVTVNENPADEVKPSGVMLIDEIQEEEKITVLTKDIIEKHWDNIMDRIRSRKENELATAMETAGVVSYEDPVVLITGENKFLTDRLKKNEAQLTEILKEEFKRDLKPAIYEKSEYNARQKAQRDVGIEEARNNPTVKELEKIFKFSSIELKKNKQ